MSRDDTQPHAPETGYPPAFVADSWRTTLDGSARVCYAIAACRAPASRTLSAQVTGACASGEARSFALSVDDFYLATRRARRSVASVHPLCATRGARGTHDVDAACDVLDAAARRPCRSPCHASTRSPTTGCRARMAGRADADLVICEGWFLEVPAQATAELVEPINALERDEDPAATWRRWANAGWRATTRRCGRGWTRAVPAGAWLRHRSAMALAAGADAAGQNPGPPRR
jgi:D-glycerate 3-kinase